MYKGKSTCSELKRIRKMIAEQNNIPLEDSECHYEGDCAGTCPKCDAEVRFLENALRKSKQLGKVVTLSGAALAFSACGNQTPEGFEVIEEVAPEAEITLDSLKTYACASLYESTKNDSLVDDDYVGIIIEPEAYPEFKGGQEALRKYLEENLVYPEKARKDSIEGKVIVSFVVEMDGSLTEIEILKSVNPLLDQEAIRVVRQMPKWEPGDEREKMALPITFKLD